MIDKTVMGTSAGPVGLYAAVKSALTVAFTVVVCAAGYAQLTNVASDGFNYSAGSLAGQNGGTGWTSSWVNDYSSGASFQLSLSGMTYSGLATSGGSLVWGSGGNGISEDSRTLPLMNSGVVYLQFLSQFGSSSGGGTPNIRLSNSGSLTGGFGGNGGSFGSVMSILDASLSPAANGSSSTSANLSTLSFVIARIDYQNHDTSLWVNPDLSTFDYENPAAPNATYAGLAPAFNTIAIYSRSPAKFDELSVMVETVPEPTSGALLLTGMGAFLIYKWNRRNTGFRRT